MGVSRREHKMTMAIKAAIKDLRCNGKLIFDPLVREGILEEDSFNNVTLVLKAFVDKRNPRTEIEIKEEL